MSILSAVETALGDQPIPRSVKKVANVADENKWQLNGCGVTYVDYEGQQSLTIRLHKPDDDLAVPFYATWTYEGLTEKGNPSWRMLSAGTLTFQKMLYDDVLAVLEDPTLAWPKWMTEGEEVSGESNA